MELAGLEPILFAGLALVAAVSGLLVIVQRHAVYSALFLIITMGSLAGLYVLLEAHFVWAVQVLVYAGAIMVLFLFVIMLLNLPREDVPWAQHDLRRILLAAALGVVLLIELILVGGAARGPVRGAALPPDFGTTETVGRLLFTKFLFPFEITSVILLVAIVGAMVLAKKHFSWALTQCKTETDNGNPVKCPRHDRGTRAASRSAVGRLSVVGFSFCTWLGARMSVPLSAYLILSAYLFVLGVIGVAMRRNALIIFMSIELMLNAVNLTFVAFSRSLQLHGRADLRLLRDGGGDRRGRGGPGHHPGDLPEPGNGGRGGAEPA